MIKVLPVSELQALCVEAERNGIALSDLDSIRSKFGVSPEAILNEVALTVAQGYATGALSYEFCDDVMNGIANAIVDLGRVGELPQPAFSLYQAFDEGEWHRNSDSPEDDPGEKYTRPLVLEILSDLER
ncbi:hypothetical protein HX792_10350 [Pseudomonas sp. B6002]|uniref:hypothetical protein n=1 Tax=Pseudomonas sp. B6002 TaxID=2726978 RepID=UPI0015A3DA9A|nr:hypothetical protein [Pseudomonas sp. B6002]NVZ50736.1 hypothetical protein [Pseudomonas sp. B6002]